MSERDDMTGDGDLDMLAGEYVLGTLDTAERAEVAARRQREPALDAAIQAWEARLGPLADHVAGVAPAPGLFQSIEARIAGDDATDTGGPPVELAALRRSLARWRLATVTAATAAAALLAVVISGPQTAPPSEHTFIAVFQQEDNNPRFLLTVDMDTRVVTIRPVTAEPQPGKAYQLWMLAKPLGPVPVSLGLLEPPGTNTRKVLSEYDPTLLRDATFGISVEPEGGSPTGKPTGPALHGTLLPALP